MVSELIRLVPLNRQGLVDDRRALRFHSWVRVTTRKIRKRGVVTHPMGKFDVVDDR